MRKLIAITVIFLALVAVFYLSKDYLGKDNYAIRINQFKMSAEKFDDYFSKMSMDKDDTPQARQGVLEALISKKLILQEAEKQGLHKSEEFLDALQHYYEQLLFKLIVDLKSKELSSQVRVTDSEVKSRYDIMQQDSLTDKHLEELYEQIKWQMLREKQTQALNDWLKSVRDQSKIDIDYDTVLKKGAENSEQ
ncbi:MAG: SurA N-terminal domain-containing protein [Candidatus Omnitrophica bacterium]|nr:SurA N-terminal domain-containing protein [Candidatus Omnitrophota bacterium]